MAQNFPGPYEVEIAYTVGGLGHKMRLNCNVVQPVSVGDTVATINLQQRDGDPINIDVAVNALVGLFQPRFGAGASFDEYILWRYAVNSFDRTFIATNTIGLNGTSGTGSNLAHQSTYTWRTFEGGIMRLVLLETIGDSDVRIPYANLGATPQAIMDFVASDDNWILARDTSYPVAPLARTGGQNEAIFKKRYR